MASFDNIITHQTSSPNIPELEMLILHMSATPGKKAEFYPDDIQQFQAH